MDTYQVDKRIKDIRVLKGSLIEEFEALKILREVQGDTLPQQKRALEQVHEYQNRWKELVRGTYIPKTG